MKVKILRGTNQIGGCITEITSNGTKIIIDFGEELSDLSNNEKKTNPMIEGLTTGDKCYDAVLITHSHGDHIGLINYVLEDIPIYVEEKSTIIYEILNDFTNRSNIRMTSKIDFEAPITIKNIKVTAYIVDHSAYNSSMLLVESNGKKILYTGDFRNHGYKGKIFESTLRKIGKVDCLITEGTSFGRNLGKYMTEEELVNKARIIFNNYNQVFILQSSTNIDRITSFYKASINSNKSFIEDLFTANITSKINTKIPNPISFKNVYVWIPLKYRKKSKAFNDKYILPLKKYSRSVSVCKDYIMLVKTSMINDIKMLKEKGKITNACLVYSIWDGYKEKASSVKSFLSEISDLGITFIDLHTSGHADIDTIKLVEEITKPNMVIPIHTTNKKMAKQIFETARVLEDYEEIEV